MSNDVKSNCYECIHSKSNNEYNSSHIRCVQFWKHKKAKDDFPILNQKGIDNGWCDFPYDFDPVWVSKCTQYKNNQGGILEHTENELLNLFNRSLSLLSVAKCPNDNCDNNGIIATQEYPSGEWIPEPCEWCHTKKELLKDSEKLQ